jgi:hypothetical protein
VGAVQVTLFATNADNSTAHLTATTDTAGHFEFKDLNSATGNTYVVGVAYQEADYFSEVQSFSENDQQEYRVDRYDASK